MAEEKGFNKDEALFLSIMYSFHAAAMQQMGKIANPFTGKVERDLDAARGTIDVLAMFQKKTQGNLTDRERRVLTNLITELQLNYVDESKREPAGEKAEPAAEAEAQATAAPAPEAEPAAAASEAAAPEAEEKAAPPEEKPPPEQGEPAPAEEAKENEAKEAAPEKPKKKPTGKRRAREKKKEG
jgi:hypothetical protein